MNVIRSYGLLRLHENEDSVNTTLAQQFLGWEEQLEFRARLQGLEIDCESTTCLTAKLPDIGDPDLLYIFLHEFDTAQQYRLLELQLRHPAMVCVLLAQRHIRAQYKKQMTMLHQQGIVSKGVLVQDGLGFDEHADEFKYTVTPLIDRVVDELIDARDN